MITRQFLERLEAETLAPYAAKSRDTKGRVYREKEHKYRGAYQRDKDRIIYSTAFRRLEYKTQVFVNHEGDYYRTRLTHTLEVVQIARTVARALCLNEDLAESIALAHDLGHTPFGHAGEATLDDIMKNHGGFEHNTHGLRVVDVLEKRYPNYAGLNLTYEVREGIAKHNSFFDKPEAAAKGMDKGMPTLEAQVVNVADEIAYDNHDLDDGLTSGLIDEKALARVALWKDARAGVRKRFGRISEEIAKFQTVKTLINQQVTDVIGNTEKRIKRLKVRSARDVRAMGRQLVSLSGGMNEKRAELREFLMNRLYRHYRVVRMSDKAVRFIRSLFEIYMNKPEQLPPNTAARLKREDKYRVICDYIAGMTDRYAQDEYKKFFEPYERV